MKLKAITQHVKHAATERSGKIVGGAALLMGSAVAHAQEAPGASAAFTAISSQASDFAGDAWPVVIGVTSALVGIKLFKKFISRAT